MGDAKHVVLSGECKLKNLNTTVFVNIDYERITPRVVRKKIRLRQSDMFLLFYQLSNRLEPLENPERLWSFNELDWRGGALHEYFPAAAPQTTRKEWSILDSQGNFSEGERSGLIKPRYLLAREKQAGSI